MERDSALLLRLRDAVVTNLTSVEYILVNEELQDVSPGDSTLSPSKPYSSDTEKILEIVLAAVAVTTVVIFVLVMALLLYVIVQAKKPTRREELDMLEDNVFEAEGQMYSKRSIPRVRFTRDS